MNSMFTRIFLLYVTTYVSRGLSTYFGTERTSLLVRRLEIVLLDDGMARIQHIDFCLYWFLIINVLEICAELNFFIGHVVSMYEDYLLSIIWYQMNGRLFRLFRCDYFMYACALEIREVMAWLGFMHVRKSGSLQLVSEPGFIWLSCLDYLWSFLVEMSMKKAIP